jgi:predicted peroxiredoxin
MMRSMKYGSMLLAMLMMVMMPMQSQAADDEAKGLFVVVTSPDAQTQMMAMVLSTKTVEQGKSVRMLLCGPGGELALKDSKQVMIKPLDKSPQMLLKNLIKNGVTVEVCPLFLPNKGATPDMLIEGVTVAKPPVVAGKLREEGVKLFTF